MKTPPLLPGWLIVATLIVFVIAMSVSLQGCASMDYWRKSQEPVLIRGIVEMERPGGRDDLLGNANYATGMIEIKPGLTGALRECVIQHERHHFEGFTHDERRGFATDCGDGTMVPFPFH